MAGKAGVITGAASGIGEGSARLFIAEGASVVLADIEVDRGKQIADELGDRAIFVETDVTSGDQVEAAIEAAVSSFGRLDFMFNNAGSGSIEGPIREITEDTFDRMMDVLAKGVFFGVKHAAARMVPQGSGSIINTSSVAALQANFGPHVYSMAKAAVIQLTKTTANELGEENVRVNAICPGGIATAIFGRGAGLEGEAAQRSAEVMETVFEAAPMQPIPRGGRPGDIAEMALFLASDASEFVSGQAIAVDGALTTGRKYSESQARSTQMFEQIAVAAAAQADDA